MNGTGTTAGAKTFAEKAKGPFGGESKEEFISSKKDGAGGGKKKKNKKDNKKSMMGDDFVSSRKTAQPTDKELMDGMISSRKTNADKAAVSKASGPLGQTSTSSSSSSANGPPPHGGAPAMMTAGSDPNNPYGKAGKDAYGKDPNNPYGKGIYQMQSAPGGFNGGVGAAAMQPQYGAPPGGAAAMQGAAAQPGAPPGTHFDAKGVHGEGAVLPLPPGMGKNKDKDGNLI